MASFAERYGHREIRTVIQRESLDADTRTELWNLLVVLRDMFRKFATGGVEDDVLDAMWAWWFKQPRDERPTDAAIWNRMKATVLEAEWFDVLDLIENVVRYLKQYEVPQTEKMAKAIVEGFNLRFEAYLVGFRFINRRITPVDSLAEADAISDGLDDAATVPGARKHLEQAIEHLADRTNPDYANSIKESISAVESVCRSITGEKTLGAALKKLEGAGVTIHPALRGAWSQMYGWTSDADGIRHGGIEEADADQALAKYMLVTCSAFVSYVTEAGRKAGLTSATQ